MMLRSAICISCLGLSPASGLIFRDGSSPAPNTETAPTGSLAGSGWEQQVYYLNYHATVISPKHVMTARHLGGSQEILTRPAFFRGGSEEKFAIKGERLLIGETDFSIFEVWETFPDYAALYQGDGEEGEEVVIHGSGVGRGDDLPGMGWKWGDSDSRKSRWGRNVIEGTTASDGSELLYFGFDDVPGQDEVAAARGDSGGGWFIREGGEWKLAGVSFTVDSWYSDVTEPSNANRFRGSFYQADDLWYGSDDRGWSLIPSSGQSNVPGEIAFYRQSHSYGSRISSSRAEIEAVIAPALAWEAKDANGRFLNWLEGYGVLAETAPTDDADGDGLSNLEEYLTESHPGEAGEAEAGLRLEVLVGGGHRITVRETLDLAGRGLSVTLESSGDLLNWDPVEDLVEQSNERNDPEGVRVRVLERAGAGPGPSFYRQRIELSPST